MPSKLSVKDQRSLIKIHHDLGLDPCEIFKVVKIHGINKMMVSRTVKRLSETGSSSDRKRSGRPRTVRTPDMIKRVRERVRRNPQQSPNKIAKGVKTSRSSVRRMIVDDLSLRPFKKRKVHGLTTTQKNKRRDLAKQLLSRHAGESLDLIVFSDEKLFSVQETHNNQNVRIYAVSFDDVPEHLRTVSRFQGEPSVMVWAGISKKGKFPLIFIEPGVKVNAEYYLDQVLKKVVKPYGDTIYKNGHWVFQQDSAPAHKAKVTQAWCRHNLPGFIDASEWPPSSPDLNPLDFCIWGYLESKVNEKRHPTLDSLRASVMKEWDDLPMNVVRAAIDSWPARLRSCIKNKGGRFE